jgi:hypothetical protein
MAARKFAVSGAGADGGVRRGREATCRFTLVFLKSSGRRDAGRSFGAAIMKDKKFNVVKSDRVADSWRRCSF